MGSHTVSAYRPCPGSGLYPYTKLLDIFPLCGVCGSVRWPKADGRIYRHKANPDWHRQGIEVEGAFWEIDTEGEAASPALRTPRTA
jgi:hypothetical protein